MFGAGEIVFANHFHHILNPNMSSHSKSAEIGFGIISYLTSRESIYCHVPDKLRGANVVEMSLEGFWAQVSFVKKGGALISAKSGCPVSLS